MAVIDRQAATPPTTSRRKSVEEYYGKAFALLRSEAVRRSLDIAKEPAPLRDRYGRNTLGQSMLLARRLVESGVRFVNVNDRIHNGQEANWDSHEKVFPRHRDHLLPPADQALSALLEDLEGRGLLESTLVVAQGEFGRSPRINQECRSRPLAARLFRDPGRRRHPGRTRARQQRQDRRLSRDRPRLAGRPGGDDFFRPSASTRRTKSGTSPDAPGDWPRDAA